MVIKDPYKNNLFFVSHRGNTLKNKKENSIDGIKKCLDNNINMIELDIRMSKDNKLIVFHDETLLRLYKKDLFVEDLTAFDLNNNYNIPLLQDVFNIIKNKSLIYLDIKGEYSKFKTYIILNKINRLLKKYKINIKNIYLACFNIELLKNLLLFKLFKLFKFNIGIICDYSNLEYFKENYQKYSFVSIDNNVFKFLCKNNLYLKPIKQKLFIWTINKKQDFKFIIKLSKKYNILIDGVISDNPLFLNNMDKKKLN